MLALVGRAAGGIGTMAGPGAAPTMTAGKPAWGITETRAAFAGVEAV